MHLVLVGADYEENLGMCMIAAAAESAGHRTSVVPLPSGAREEAVLDILALRPDVVGLAAQFQHRGLDFLGLACDLRRAGFCGHITAGGQFATMAAGPILSGGFGVDSVVLYEGERTIAELLGALAARRPLTSVAGLALPDGKGGSLRTAPRPLTENLDELPTAHRYRRHSRQLGVPFIPVSGSRGCWSACSFCSITSVLRDGRAHGVAGRRLRLRSPEDVGREMAMLAHAVGGSAVFCFHDENFLLPSPDKTLARLRAIRRTLDAQGIGRAALVGKCRPDTVTKDLARELARLGVVRMYVGIENTSDHGARNLNRGVDVATMAAALDAFAEAGIFTCYNLLVFEPESTLDDVARNIAFMRAHAETPINFCRAEPYLGTPMYQRLRAEGRLSGGFLGCDYRITDDRAELLFRIASSAFREHNFAADGVANRYMSLGYSAKLLEFFYRDAAGRQATLMERAQELTRSITLDSADLLQQAWDIAASADLADHDRIARQTALLGLRVAASDRLWHAALDGLERDMSSFARGEAQARPRSLGRVVKAAQNAAVAGWLALWATGGTTSCKPYVVDSSPAPDSAADDKRDTLGRDMTVVDMVPADSGARSDVGKDTIVIVDPLPPDAGARNDLGKDTIIVVDAVPPDAGARNDLAAERPLIYDPLPPDAGARDTNADEQAGIDGGTTDVRRDAAAERPIIVDPPPYPVDARDVGPVIVDMAPRDAAAYDNLSAVKDAGINEPPFIVDPVVEAREGLQVPAGTPGESVETTREHWALTTPTRIPRSQDLPLFLCPEAKLAGEWQGGKVRAFLRDPGDKLSTRWQAQGRIEGDGTAVVWTPISDEDQLDVAVRTAGGVAVALLRLEQVCGRKSG
jgi:anaerobic magnesium-protoporphyrin IX monomethyl ester cyclase